MQYSVYSKSKKLKDGELPTLNIPKKSIDSFTSPPRTTISISKREEYRQLLEFSPTSSPTSSPSNAYKDAPKNVVGPQNVDQSKKLVILLYTLRLDKVMYLTPSLDINNGF